MRRVVQRFLAIFSLLTLSLLGKLLLLSYEEVLRSWLFFLF